jgi:hypothetical protein
MASWVLGGLGDGFARAAGWSLNMIEKLRGDHA